MLRACSTFARTCELEQQRRELVAKAVDVPLDAELNEDFCEAVAGSLQARARSRSRSAKGDARKLIAAVTVTGVAPASKADWELVQATLDWRTEARKVLGALDSLSTEFGLEAAGAGVDAGFKKVAHWQASIEEVRQLTFDFDAKLHARLEEVFGKRDRRPHVGRRRDVRRTASTPACKPMSTRDALPTR